MLVSGLQSQGGKVCITGHRQQMLDKVAQSLPSGTVTTCSGDVSKEDDVAHMVETAVPFGGKLDVLVNNAAVSSQGPVGAALVIDAGTAVVDVLGESIMGSPQERWYHIIKIWKTT